MHTGLSINITITRRFAQVDLQSVRDSVKYCCFLLEAEVTDSALLALSKEILSDKVRALDRNVPPRQRFGPSVPW